jgi:nicotinate-nucleotide pyrophosphorylase (carboxylating)
MEQAKHPDLNACSLAEFGSILRQSGLVRRLIELARDEDLGIPPHDWTGELMFVPDEHSSVKMCSRASGVLAGTEFLSELVETFSAPGEIKWTSKISDGDEMDRGTVIAEFTGNARAIVRLERTMLNLIARLSGIATLTRAYVELVDGTGAKICDTRKTTPGLRVLEKYAVRCGGGTTHRMGLNDAVLIKDNHLAGLTPDELAPAIESLAARARDSAASLWFIQVEVDTLEQLAGVLQIRPGIIDIVLLDNMTIEQLKEAVALRDQSAPGIELEASGGVSLETVRSIALTGVDRISIGALTHQAQSLDIGLDAR